MALIAKHIQLVRPSETKAMTQKAAALREQGRQIITLSQGEPDFDTPENIREAGIRAIKDGWTRYTAVAGVNALREAIQEKFRRDNNLDYSLDQIIASCGAKQVIFNALFATIEPGDEVIVPAPCWVSYPDMVRLTGGTAVVIECSEADGFKLRPAALEQAITPRTKWLMLNSPSNPTGAVYTAEDLSEIAEVLRRYPNVWVLSDDIYEKLIYGDDRFVTILNVAPDLFDRTLTVNGVSKTNAMTGWRVGYGAGPVELIKAMTVIQGQTTSHTSSISQIAAIEAISGDQTYVAKFVSEFKMRRQLVVSKLNQASGIRCHMPDGAFYVFPSCAGVIGKRTASNRAIVNDTEFSMYLLEEAGVAVVPGAGFMVSPYIRISYASSMNDLSDACDRIILACKGLVA